MQIKGTLMLLGAASFFSSFLSRNVAIYLTSRFAFVIIRLRDVAK